MRYMKVILSIITIIFAGLGLFEVIPFDISNPIMLTSLATVLFLRGLENKKNGDKSGFFLMILTAVFLYGVVVYNAILHS